MTAYEKAHELIFKMDLMPDKSVMYFNKDEIFESCKKGALNCVDEILSNVLEKDNFYDSEQWEFYNNVKKEIEKL